MKKIITVITALGLASVAYADPVVITSETLDAMQAEMLVQHQIMVKGVEAIYMLIGAIGASVACKHLWPTRK